MKKKAYRQYLPHLDCDDCIASGYI
jgi:hypothetical protein